MDRELQRIAEQIADFIPQNGGGKGEDAKFNELALRLFECQCRLIEPYGQFCRQRNKSPKSVKFWTDIPAVPADAFKRFFLFAGGEKDVVKSFRSSGTTQPGVSSQAHFSREGIDLMNLAVEINARRRLFSDGVRPRIFVLAPSPESAPHMIMVHGMNRILSQFGDEGSRFCVGADGLEITTLLSELKRCCAQEVPAALVGSSFGFVHLFDEMKRQNLKFKLPERSRLMDAGGYKGRSREIDRSEFVRWAADSLGLASERITNLLGMTEMASQIYDGPGDPATGKRGVAVTRMKQTPRWVRTRVMNPARWKDGDLEEITEADRPGLLRHLDLANVERPMMIQTEDVGIRRESGFDVLRRVKGAEPRGCSLSFEEFASRTQEKGNVHEE